MCLDGKYFTGVMLDIPRKATLARVAETVVSRCFVGCLGQGRKRCSNRCCCGPRNYASDVRPTDPLAAGVESPSQTLAPPELCLNCYCRTKILKKKQPSDRGGSSLVVKCSTFLHRILYF